MSVLALVPAAGKGRRMGRPKLALPLGDRTVIECVLGALAAAQVRRRLVVLAPHGAELEPLVRAAGADVLMLPQATEHMRQTVQHGLDWMAEHYRPTPGDHWLLLPADHPTLDPCVVAALTQALAQRKGEIALPIHQGKRGHPALISWRLADGLRTFPAELGLNAYLRQFTAETIEVDWPDPSVLLDLDTPEDYERLIAARSNAR